MSKILRVATFTENLDGQTHMS